MNDLRREGYVRNMAAGISRWSDSAARGWRVGSRAVFALCAMLAAGTAAATSDLEVTVQTSNTTPVAGGAAFAYTVTVVNHGPSDALNVRLTDPLPPGVVFFNLAVVNNPSVAGYGLTCSGPAVGANGVVTCGGTMPGPVSNNNSTAVITIVVGAADNLAGGVRTNTATVASDTQEASPNTFPNTGSVQITIGNNANLSIGVIGPASITRGSNLVYEISLTNSGDSDAVNVVVLDQLPPSLSFVSMFGTGVLHDSCVVSPTNQIACSPGFVPTGVHRLGVVAKSSPITPLGTLGNTVSVSAAVGATPTPTATANVLVNP